MTTGAVPPLQGFPAVPLSIGTPTVCTLATGEEYFTFTLANKNALTVYVTVMEGSTSTDPDMRLFRYGKNGAEHDIDSSTAKGSDSLSISTASQTGTSAWFAAGTIIYLQVYAVTGGTFYVLVNYNNVSPTVSPSRTATGTGTVTSTTSRTSTHSATPSTTPSVTRTSTAFITPSPSASHGISPSTSPGSAEANANVITINLATGYNGSVTLHEIQYFAFTIPYNGPFCVSVVSLTPNGDPDVVLDVTRPSLAQSMLGVKSSRMNGGDQIFVYPYDFFYKGIYQMYYLEIVGYTATGFSINISSIPMLTATPSPSLFAQFNGAATGLKPIQDQLAMWRRPFSLCGVGLGLLDIQGVVLEQQTSNTSCSFHVYSADCINCTIRVPFGPGAQGGAVAARIKLQVSGLRATSWMALPANITLAMPTMWASWPQSVPLVRSRAMLQLWALPEQRPDSTDWLASGMAPPPPLDILAISLPDEQCMAPMYISTSSFMCAVPSGPAPPAVHAILSTTFEVVGQLNYSDIPTIAATSPSELLAAPRAWYIDNVTIIFHAEHINPLHFSNISIAGLQCGRLVEHRNSSLICANIGPPSVFLSGAGSVAFVWSSQSSGALAAALSIVTQPTILGVFPPYLAVAGDWIVVVGLHMAADSSSPLPVVKVAAIECRNCSFVSPNSPNVILCLAPGNLPDPTILAAHVVVERAGVPSAPWILYYPPMLSATWNFSQAVQLHAEQTLLMVTPDLRLALRMKANASVVCSMKASVPRCRGALQGVGAVTQATLHGESEQQVTTSSSGAATLLFRDIQLVVASACNFSLIASCRDNKGGSTESRPLPIRTPAFSFAWRNIADSKGVLPNVLQGIQLQIKIDPTDADTGFQQATSCRVSVADMAASTSVVLEPNPSLNITDGSVIVEYNAAGVSLDFGKVYVVSSTCMWQPSSEQFILDDIWISTLDVALFLSGPLQVNGYSPTLLHTMMLVNTTVADFDPGSITCNVRLVSSTSTLISLLDVTMKANTYSVSPGGLLEPHVTVAFASALDDNATVALDCLWFGRHIASNELTVQVSKPVLTVVHNVLGSAIWASSVDEDPSSVPIGSSFTISISAPTVSPLRCQPVLTSSICTGDAEGGNVASTPRHTSVLSSGGIYAENASTTETLVVTLPVFGIFANAGCSVSLMVECADGVNRSLTASVGAFQVTMIEPQWLVQDTPVFFQPDVHTMMIGELTSVPQAIISAAMIDNQREQRNALWSCVALLEPLDTLISHSSALLSNSKTLAELSVAVVESNTTTSWLITVDLTCPECLLNQRYVLQTECAYAPTSERVRFPELNVSTPTVHLEWTSNTNSRVFGAVVPDGIGTVELVVSVDPSHVCTLAGADAWECEAVVVSADLAVTATNISEVACFRSQAQIPVQCHASVELPALPLCELGQLFNLYGRCQRISSSTTQYWLSHPLAFSTPELTISWESETALVHVGQQEEANLVVSALSGVALSSNVSCSVFIAAGSAEITTQQQLGQSTETDGRQRVKMSFSIYGASGTAFQLQSVCTLWKTSVRSTPLQLTIASYNIRAISHPSAYIPSDRSQVWPATPALQVAVVDDDNASMKDAWCAVTSTVGTEIIPVAGRDISTVRANVTDGTINFPPFGFKASFADSLLEAVVSCNVASMLPVPEARIVVNLDPIFISSCSFPGGTRRPGPVDTPIVALVLRNESSPSINRTACTSNLLTDELLPPISCKISCKDSNSSCALVSLEGALTMMGGNYHTGTFSGFSISAPQNATFQLQLICTIGSIIIPGPPPSQVHIQGCAAGSQPAGVYCSSCDSDTYSYGGDNAFCQRCPETGASCADGNIILLPNFYRSGTTMSSVESSTRLYPCLNAEACLVNSSTQAYSCAAGYTGPVCSLCDVEANYAKFGGFCRACWSPGLIGVFCLLLFAAALGLVALATFSKQKLNEATVATLRILLSYIQTAGSLSVMKAGGTRAYHDVLGWTEVVAIYPLSIGALQCIWEPSYLVRFVVTVALPLLTALSGVIMLLLWLTSRQWCCPKHEIGFPVTVDVSQNMKVTDGAPNSSICAQIKKRYQLRAIFWVAMCVMYMPITSAAIRVFDCYYPDIDGVYYLRQDMRVPCYNAEHFLVRTMAIVVLAVVTGGFPVFVIWSLGRVSLDSSRYSRRQAIWRFVAAGYQRLAAPSNDRHTSENISSARKRSIAGISAEIFRGSAVIKHNFRKGHIAWWQATELVRQSGMIFLIFVIVNPYVQATGASAWTLIFLLLHMKTWPYRSFVLNLCQFLNLASSLCVSLLCTALLQYDVTSAEMVSQTAADMSFYSWFVTTAVTTVSLGTLAVLALIAVILQFAVVAEKMNLSSIHATHRRFSSMGMPRASFRPVSRMSTAQRMVLQGQQPFALKPPMAHTAQ